MGAQKDEGLGGVRGFKGLKRSLQHPTRLGRGIKLNRIGSQMKGLGGGRGVYVF
jgi:hypothetical protein